MLAIVPATPAAATRRLSSLRLLPTACTLPASPGSSAGVSSRLRGTHSKPSWTRLWPVRLTLNMPPRARALVPGIGTALMFAIALTACGRSTRDVPIAPGAPSIASVSHGRFVTTVLLGRGDVLVTPPPDGARARLPETTAWSMFESSDSAQGAYAFAILGLAVATVVPTVPLQAPATALTVPGTSKAASPTSAPTTSAPTSTPTTAAPPTTPPLPSYNRRLAWVGIAWGGVRACPAAAASGNLQTNTTEVAVLIDAVTGHDVIAYTSGTDASCTGPASAPTVVRPNQVVSVPWQPIGPASTAVRVTVPPCGRYDGWTQLVDTGAQLAVQVLASVPFDPLCTASSTQVEDVDDVVPLGSAQQQVQHAALGSVDELRVLPGGVKGGRPVAS